MLADITPVILTYNEAPNIGRSLERLTWARQVVIVDSGSTDDTLAIAGRFPNVRAVQRPFDAHAQQWQFATTETGITSGWILRLDADYMMEPALRDEIEALVPAESTVAYRIAFIYCIHGRPLRASLYPALPVLFRRGRASLSRMAILKSSGSMARLFRSRIDYCTMIARAWSAGCRVRRAISSLKPRSSRPGRGRS